MEEMSVSTFHIGYLVTAACCGATMHLMIVIGEPDLSDAETRHHWRQQILFLKTALFLVLFGFFFTHFGQEQLYLWFFPCAVATPLLFLPAHAHLAPQRGLARGGHEEGAAPRHDSEGAHDTPAWSSPSASASDQSNRPLSRPPGGWQPLSETQVRILVANLAFGALMGASILLPIVLGMGVIAGASAWGWMAPESREFWLRLAPGLGSLLVPVMMPTTFLALGPWILSKTQKFRDLRDDPKWKSRLDTLFLRSRILGYTDDISKTRVFSLSWQDLGLHTAFYLGLPSRWNPLARGVFVTESMENVLSEDEMEFVLAHELAHGLRRHPVKRTRLGLALFILFAVTETLSLLLRSPALCIGFAVSLFLVGVWMLRRQSELQELESDIVAVQLMGGSANAADAAARALEKLDAHNLRWGQSQGWIHPATTASTYHPETQRRTASLRQLFRPSNTPSGSPAVLATDHRPPESIPENLNSFDEKVEQEKKAQGTDSSDQDRAA